MGSHLDEKEARERIEDRLRRNGYDKRNAASEADSSVGRVFDNHARRAGMSQAEQARKPRSE